MADYAAKIANEKLKGLALMVRNGAVLLGAASAARWYNIGFDLVLGSWVAVALVMTYIGTQLLSLMQEED